MCGRLRRSSERYAAAAACRNVKILVGGYPFNVAPTLWQAVGADALRVVRRASGECRQSARGGRSIAMNSNADRGIALMCEPNGIILEVIRDDFGITHAPARGTPVTTLASNGGSAKFGTFLDAVRSDQMAFDWELIVTVGDRPTLMYFTGGRTNDDKLLSSEQRRVRESFGYATSYSALATSTRALVPSLDEGARAEGPRRRRRAIASGTMNSLA